MRNKRRCFASWCQSGKPRELDLDPDLVAWLCLIMASPEMRGITSLEDLNQALRLRRTKLRFPDALSWNRAWLSAKAMFIEWKSNGGRV
jgi:hypothetical protein